MSTFVISCGGTGGHLSPGIALAEGLIERGHECHLVVSCKRVDACLISQYPDLECTKIPGVAFSVKPLALLKFLYYQVKAIFFAINLIRKKRPDTVIGFGGFTTLSFGIGSFLLGCPIVLHEANRCAGKAIRLLSVWAKRVYLPPGVELKSLPPKTIRHFGYPVRKEVRPLMKHDACRKLGLRADVKRLLVMGGSQGAEVLNQWVLSNFEKLALQGIDVFCVTGMGKSSQGKLEYVLEDGKMSQAVFVPFIDNISEVLSISDLVVSRAGAGSIAEFSRCGLPCILVPYPWASSNHQVENARFLERQGGGIVLEEKQLDRLYSEVLSMIFNDWLLDKMQRNLKRMEAYNSLDLIADDLEVLCLINEPVSGAGEVYKSL